MAKIAIVNFNAGEITPDVDAREDIEKYTGGCRKCENMIPDVYGNATKRPGTEFVTIGGAGCYFDTSLPDDTKIGISTVAQLALIGNDAAYPLDGDYELLNDIDLNVAPYNTGDGWQGIGSSKDSVTVYAFRGTFDGRYHTISNLYIDDDDFLSLQDGGALGLFGGTFNATIQNVLLTNIDVKGRIFVGGLVGEATDTDFIHCHTEGTITTEINHNATNSHTGGFGSTQAGGNTFTRCSAIVDVICEGEGWIYATPDGAFTQVGNFAGNPSDGVYTDCYARGTVSAITPGGLRVLRQSGPFGYSNTGATFTNCYAATTVDTSLTMLNTENGGFIGHDPEPFLTYSDCFWDNTINTRVAGDQGTDHGPDLGDNVTAKTTAQMYAKATYTNWDFDTVWLIREGAAYPVHKWYDQCTRCVWLHN